MFSPELLALADKTLTAARARQWRIATAESCTGGLTAGVLTEIAGASDVFERGFVTYSNGAKTDLLGVPAPLIALHGAVSAEVAVAMAEGALVHSRAEIAVAITGIAGPGGGSAQKPVGLVHFALATRGGPTLSLERRYGEKPREAIRLAAVADALALLKQGASRLMSLRP